MQKASGIVWNHERPVGPRTAYKVPETQAIMSLLQGRGDFHDACLFSVGIDSLLRGVDLLRLRVLDLVHPYGEVRQEVLQRQKKTSNSVAPVLTPTTQRAIEIWVRESGKGIDDYVFTRTKKGPEAEPICDSHARVLLKGWTAEIGLDPAQYSLHSMRRTKPTYLYKFGLATIAEIAVLLGHSDIESVLTYLGITREEAQFAALSGDIFTADPNANPLGHPMMTHFLEPNFINQLADALVDRLAPKVAEIIDKNHLKGTK
ncbi:MAG: tyrosine-type recombinase/integrase [Pseudomonadota bacterium]